jgi:hypothetical protein
MVHVQMYIMKLHVEGTTHTGVPSVGVIIYTSLITYPVYD